jgi:uroporphyrinogen decarboxylase
MGLSSGQGPDRPLLAVLRGERRDPPPVWLMRQAGRYLPEYRELRASKGGFLELCYDPESAAEVTIQPIRRFGFDGAILFSDILVIPHALGQELSFTAGEGPRLAPPLKDATLEALRAAPERLSPIYATVRRVAASLPPETTFLGFAGAPWTVATYMVAGEGSKDHADARTLAYRDPQAFAAIIDAIVDATILYLGGQIEAGVHAVQIFDSWAGSLAPAEFERWVIAPTVRIVDALHARYPDVPVIGFPKGAGGRLAAYAREVRPDAIGLDETVDPVWANSVLPDALPVQGNLDPLALLAGGIALEEGVARIRKAFATRPHVFNLGHGITPQVPIAHVERLLELVRTR